MKKKLLSALAALMVCGGVSAQDWEWVTIPDNGSTGTYYLYSKNQNKFLNDNNGLDETPLVSWTIATSNGSGFPGSVNGDSGFSLTSSNEKQLAMYRSGSFFNYKYNVESNQSGKTGSDISLCSEFSDGYYSLCRSSKSDNWSGNRNVATTATGLQIVKDASIEWRFITLDEYNEFVANKTAFDAYVTAYNNAANYDKKAELSDNLKQTLEQTVANNATVNASNINSKTTALIKVVEDCNHYIDGNVAIPTSFTCVQGNGPKDMGSFCETYNGDDKNFAVGKILYNTVTGLLNGYYEVQFHANTQFADWSPGLASGDGRAQVYVNDIDQDITIPVNKSQVMGDAYTFIVHVTSGTIEYGLKNKAEGGNWAWVEKDAQILFLGDETSTLSVKDGKYGTFCAPYSVTLPAGVSAYSVTNNGTYVSMNQVAAAGGILLAGNPVIVKNESGADVSETYYGNGSTGTVQANGLVGFYEDGANIPMDAYVLQTQNDVQQFYKVTGAFTGSKNRCYLPADAAGVKVLSIDGEETAIEEIFGAEKLNGQIYDLNGRRVSKPGKGIYVVNGKKVLF